MNDEDEVRDLIREKLSDGVVAVLCENVEDIENVEKLLKNCHSDEFVNLSIYNPEDPHFSKPDIILEFLERLQNINSASQRKGKRLILKSIKSGFFLL